MSQKTSQEMSEAAVESRRAYQRAWAAAHPEKRRATQARYWERRAERERAAAAQGQDAGKE